MKGFKIASPEGSTNGATHFGTPVVEMTPREAMEYAGELIKAARAVEQRNLQGNRDAYFYVRSETLRVRVGGAA